MKALSVKNFKRLCALCLCFAMVMSVAACAGGGASTPNNASSATAAPATSAPAAATSAPAAATAAPVETSTPVQEEEVITLTMIQRLPASYVLENNPVIEEWGKRTNTILEIESPPINNYSDRVNIVMASGDLPDIILLNNTGSLYHGWAKDGLLVQMDDYLENSMPNAKAVLTDDELYYVRVAALNNELYSLPRVQTKPYDTMIYRKDWLENLGLEVPKTPAEFGDVMLAFAKNDPDGNGSEDTYGFSYNTVMGALFRGMVSGFGIRPMSVPDANGNYQIMQAQDGYMEFMDWMRDLYIKGALDPEWYLVQMYEDDDKFNAGKLGCVYVSKTSQHMITIMSEAFTSANPTAELQAGPPLRKEGDTVSNVYYNPQIWGNYAINADSKHIDRAVKFLDYGYTDDCNELLMYGIEGITYTNFDPVRRFASKTEEQKAEAAKFTSSYMTINYQTQNKGLLMANGSTEEELAVFNDAYNLVGKEINLISYMPEGPLPGISEANVTITDKGIDTKYKELRTKYICNQISRDEYVNFLQNEYIPAYGEHIRILTESGLNK